MKNLGLGVSRLASVIMVSALLTANSSRAEIRFMNDDPQRAKASTKATQVSAHVDTGATADLASDDHAGLTVTGGAEVQACQDHQSEICVSAGAAGGKAGQDFVGGFKLRIHGQNYAGPEDAPVSWAPDMEAGATITPQNTNIQIMTVGARRIDPNGYIAFQLSPINGFLHHEDSNHLAGLVSATIRTERRFLNGLVLVDASAEAGLLYFVLPDAAHTYTDASGNVQATKTRAYPGYYISTQAGARVYAVEVPSIGRLYIGLKAKYEGMGYRQAAISDADGNPKTVPTDLPMVQTQQVSGGLTIGFGSTSQSDTVF